jgi:hypothetical protein
MIPAYAAHRDALADETDPQRRHRFSMRTSAFANSLTSSFVVPPHDDSGVACEAVAFTNRNGPLPDGHEWDFAVGGHIHPLPNMVGKSVALFVKGSDLFHGTLPTSSVEDTCLHGNHGSALVTKVEMIRALRAQAARGECTSLEKTASPLYTAQESRHLPRMQPEVEEDPTVHDLNDTMAAIEVGPKCSICGESFTGTASDPRDRDRSADASPWGYAGICCGQPFHYECVSRWCQEKTDYKDAMRSRASSGVQVTCPACRKPWPATCGRILQAGMQE